MKPIRLCASTQPEPPVSNVVECGGDGGGPAGVVSLTEGTE